LVCQIAFFALALWSSALQPASAAGERLLIFTKTAGYRHDSIPAAVAALRAIAARHDIEVEHTEDAELFQPVKLSLYKAVAFVNTTGDVLDEAQQNAFRAYVSTGGGFLGVHSAADTEHGWPWYGELVGASFKSHPPGLQTGIIRFALPLADEGLEWRVTDEFYNFRTRPDSNALVVAVLDESTYEGGEMGPDHPIAWCHKGHGGPSWYTGLGHSTELYGDRIFLNHLGKGVLYAISRSQDC